MTGKKVSLVLSNLTNFITGTKFRIWADVGFQCSFVHIVSKTDVRPTPQKIYDFKLP